MLWTPGAKGQRMVFGGHGTNQAVRHSGGNFSSEHLSAILHRTVESGAKTLESFSVSGTL